MQLKDKLRPTEKLHIALENMDLAWFADEVKLIKNMWKYGCPIWEMAERVKRTQEEVLILLIDLKVGGRKNGVYGTPIREVV